MQDFFPEWYVMGGYSYRVVAWGAPRSMHFFTLHHTWAETFPVTSLLCIYFDFWRLLRLVISTQSSDKYTHPQNARVEYCKSVRFTYLASGFASALFTPICPLGVISWPSSIKGQIQPHASPRGPNEVSCQTPIMQLPGCSIRWPLVSCFTQSNPDKGPFDGLPFFNQSTPSPLGLQHLLQCNLILYSVQPDPIDKLNLSEPDILMPPRGK